ncbi:MAG: ATP-binding protein [Defluviitaleaceae bacterium]|nr:ATP-binding protein [Defluviitaleaceae bacterium]
MLILNKLKKLIGQGSNPPSAPVAVPDETEKNPPASETEATVHLLSIVNHTAAKLLASDIDTFEQLVFDGMKELSEALKVDRMYIWENTEIDGEVYATRKYEWSENVPSVHSIPLEKVPYSELPALQGFLNNERAVNALVCDLSPVDQKNLALRGILSILVLPIKINNHLWGFLGCDNCASERLFTASEEMILRCASLMFGNAYRHNQALWEIQKNLAQQSLVARISQGFLANKDIDILVEKSLKLIGEFTEVAQVLLLTVSKDSPEIEYVYEWLNPGYTPISRKGETQEISPDVLNHFRYLAKKGKYYITSDEPDMREVIAPYRKNYKNFVLTSIFLGNDFHALLDFSRPEDKPWTSDEISIMEVTSHIIMGVLQRQTMQEHLISAKETAEAASRHKTNFLANMSHEIRTPMNAILGVAEIKLREESLSLGAREGFARIYDSGNLLLNIINNILDLSKIEAGKLELMPVKYALPTLVNDSIQLNLLRYESKPIEFLIEMDESTPLNMVGDEVRLKQILNNILSNSFKYTEKGEVNMSVWAENTFGYEDEVILCIRISDTGQGMTQKQLGVLFEEYTRFNSDANRTTVGTGLGMSITKHLLKKMGGKIDVKSQLGKGSVFTVRIPQQLVDDTICGAETVARLRELRFSSTSVSGKKYILHKQMPHGSVLIVDDMESNIYVTMGMLEPYGLQIETAMSGYEAIEKVKEGKTYDIIFMDHMMPKMDGMETTSVLRELGYNSPVVALTANALVGQAQIFLDNGFDAYIAKPIDSRELDSVLMRFVE